MQKSGKNVKATIAALFLAPFILYACMVIFVLVFPSRYYRCDFYNEKLGGGFKEFQGKRFKINMCGSGGDDNSNNDKIQLEILGSAGELLAKRHFVVHWESNFEKKLKYYPNHILYFDSSDENDFEKTIDIPPTTLDWITARLPLLN